MATNDFLVFGVNAGANVMSQADYAALASRGNGFSAGTAVSAQLNKAWRQSSVIASVVAQYIADNSGKDVLDNGNPTAVLNNLSLAISNVIKGAGVGWDKVTDKPTTVAGYGITDLYTKTEVDAALLLKANSADVAQALSLKANNANVVSDLASKANKADVYSKTQTLSSEQVNALLEPINSALTPATTSARGLARLATVDEARAMANQQAALTPFSLYQSFKGPNQLLGPSTIQVVGDIIFQSGTVTVGPEGSGSGDIPVTFPRAYPNKCWVIATLGYTGAILDNANYAQVRNKTLTGFSAQNQWAGSNNNISGTIDWISFGY